VKQKTKTETNRH